MTRDKNRHSRHQLFSGIGPQGQGKISRARVAVVGCGALGSRSAELLARSGVGSEGGGLIRIIDRDYVDPANLQRQTLFTEADARSARPKATAAADHLLQIDSALRIEPHIRELNALNGVDFLRDVDLILDGTDNFRSRYVINDAAIVTRRPWIYGGAVAAHGLVSFIFPPDTPCFRCYLAEMPPVGLAENCDTAGIVTTLPSIVSGLQVTLALQFLAGATPARGMIALDVWNAPGATRLLLGQVTPDPLCSSCGTGELPALHESGHEVVTLCGRNSVQIHGVDVDLGLAETRFSRLDAPVHRHSGSISVEIAEGMPDFFDDGRAIIEGTTDPLEAKNILTRYVGA